MMQQLFAIWQAGKRKGMRNLTDYPFSLKCIEMANVNDS